MHADITRDTFRPARQYVGLVIQQGRVQLDADVNEQSSIERDRRRQLGAGTIGPAGVEKDSGAFLVEIAPGGGDLLIGPGRMWVDGRLIENEPQPVDGEVTGLQTVELDTVGLDGRPLEGGDWYEVVAGGSTFGPFTVQGVNAATSTLTATGAMTGVPLGAATVRRVTSLRSQPHARDRVDVTGLADGQYAVVLDVWDREVTPIDDPAMNEVALNGSETATRLQAAWRVEVVRIGPGSDADCTTTVPGFPPPALDGRLAALVDTASSGDDPCILPDAGGYRGLEHQLYRVEVHRVIGNDVVFKWQRDNANLTSRVDAVGTVFHVDDIGRDVVSGFQEVGFVELTDEALILANSAGDLLKVSTINRATREIAVDTSFAEPHAETAVTRASDDFRPRARRWDGRAIASINNPNQQLELERGLFVRIEGTEFREGDYWLIAARTATVAEPSSIEWPRADDGTELAVPPHGVVHAHAKLAVARRGPNGWDGGPIVDCRPRFPHLTDIEASDVAVDPTTCGFDGVTTVQEAIDELCARSSGTCSRTAVPGAGWASVFASLPGDGSAEVCFPVGDFPTDDPVEVVGNGGHLLVHGAGWGARIDAGTADSALIFRGWGSVTVRDLFVGGGDGGTRTRPNPVEGLRGAISFHDCGDVTVERVRVRTVPRPARATSAISVYGSGGSTAGANRARVAHCSIEVGDRQVGVLGVDLGRLVVEDNVLDVVPTARVIGSITDLAVDEIRSLERIVARDLRRGPSAASRPTVTIGGASHSFATSPEGANFWTSVLGRQRTFPTMRDFTRFRDRTVRTVLAGGDASPAGVALHAALTTVARQRVPVMGQGIVAGGRGLGDVVVHNNHVGPAIRGIQVGVSHQAPRSAVADEGDRVLITGNRVAVTVPAEGARGRHGIFCGNAQAITIRDNELSFTSSAADDPVDSTGIRVFGFVDRVINIRENFVDGFDTSIAVFPLLPRGTGQFNRTRLYQVRENTLVQAGAGVRVDGPLQQEVVVADNSGG